jgi:hypothetical protein
MANDRAESDSETGELFQIGAHDADQITHSLFGGLAVSGHVVADVVLHKLGHQAVDRCPCCREPLENVRALLVVVERAQMASDCPITFLVPLTTSSFSCDVCNISRWVLAEQTLDFVRGHRLDSTVQTCLATRGNMRLFVDSLENVMTRRGLYRVWEPARKGEPTPLVARRIDLERETCDVQENEEAVVGEDAEQFWIRVHAPIFPDVSIWDSLR